MCGIGSWLPLSSKHKHAVEAALCPDTHVDPHSDGDIYTDSSPNPKRCADPWSCTVQFWLAPFIVQHESLEKRRNYFTGRPAVHHGFQRCWNVNGLGANVVARVCRIAAEAAAKGRRLRVITTGAKHLEGTNANAENVTAKLLHSAFGGSCEPVRRVEHVCPCQRRSTCGCAITVKSLINSKAADCSGHSLGGALATLAAYEIAKTCPEIYVACYTFGAPRTGNHAFARCAVAVSQL